MNHEKEPRKHQKIQQQPPVVTQTPTTTTDPESFARSYQLEALEKAIQQNTIAFLDTGSGKTLIAIMLIRYYAHQLRKPSRDVAIFLVPTVVLVTQQAEVIEMHTDLKVRKLWGDLGVDYWDHNTWKAQLEKYEVFVMTPQILLDALRHSFINLSIIKLLILDECHNARGKTPYACILTEFYHPQLDTGSTHLPRIFGMTASPIKSKGSSSNMYGKQILELECLLHSKVYTVAKESVLAEFIPLSHPKWKYYDHVDILHPLVILLTDPLKRLGFKYVQYLKTIELEATAEDSAKKRISRLLATFLFCLTDLGVWVALQAAETLSSAETDILFWGQKMDATGDRTLRNFSKDVFQELSAYIPSDPQWHIGDDIGSDLHGGFITSKVKCLIESLMQYRSIKELRCIIFVERVITAIVLETLLSQLSALSGWNTTYMAGTHSGLQSQSRNAQFQIIDAFRNGDINIIVATQILEEGLDVQSCNLVIRFDPPATVCSFIQSRGRARMPGSDYILMVQSEDTTTRSKLENYLESGDIMREESLRYALLPCAPLEREMYVDEFYRVESSGAIVTLSSSVALIYFYCSRLPSDRYFRPTPRFIIEIESSFCTLYLPNSCPILTVRAQGPNNMLKKIVCLEACRKLHEVGALTDHLLPDLVVDEGDAQDFEDISYEDEQVNYFSRELVSQGQPQMLYHCYHISLKRNFDYDVSLSDFTLLTECSFRGDFEFPLEFELHSNRGSVTVSLVYTGPTHLTPEQVLTAIKFQITVLRLLIDPDLNKLKDAIKGLLEPNDNSLPRVNYLLLPSVGCNKRRPSHSDWDIRSHSLFPSASSLSHGKYCSTKRNLQAKNGLVCSCMLKSSLVFTPHNGYIYCITGILYELDGKSLIKSKGEDIPTTYKKYYHSRYGIKLHYEGQPLLNARHIFTVRNWLQRSHNSNIKEPSNAYVELPPELCEIIMSPIAISTMYTFSLVPSIMHRIESALLASNLKKMQQNHCIHNFNIPTIKILEAITTKKCQEEFSLESLETLGDSFLKYATCKHLFMHNKNFHEGLLSAKKDRIISNHSLCNLGCDRKLQGFIRNECFDPKKWVIPGDPSGCDLLTEILLPFSSEKIYTVGLKRIKRKVIADAVEALVGAYLSTGGESAALLFIDWLGMKVDFRTEAAIQKSQFLVQPQMHVNIRQLELLIGYSFRDPLLLLEALTHGSYQLPDIPGCYQRLEFLGDSVLDYLLTVYLYDKYPGISPGLLTDLRSASVNNDCYALATVKAGLHKYILHASSKLQNQICLLVKKFEQTSMESIFGWESDISLPKVLGDVIESLAGAIFVDSEYNKDIVWKCIRPLLEPLVTLDTVRLHPVRELTELCRQNSFKLTTDVSYVLNGVAALTVEVEANGISHCHTSTGENKKTAKRLASKVVLESLKESIL